MAIDDRFEQVFEYLVAELNKRDMRLERMVDGEWVLYHLQPGGLFLRFDTSKEAIRFLAKMIIEEMVKSEDEKTDC